MGMSSTDLGASSQKPSTSELPSKSSSAASSASASRLRARQPFDIDKVVETAWGLPDGLDVVFRDVVTGHALAVWSKEARCKPTRSRCMPKRALAGRVRVRPRPVAQSRTYGHTERCSVSWTAPVRMSMPRCPIGDRETPFQTDNPRRNPAVASTLDVKGRTPDAALCQASGIPAHGVRRRRVPETLDAAYGPWP